MQDRIFFSWEKLISNITFSIKLRHISTGMHEYFSKCGRYAIFLYIKLYNREKFALFGTASNFIEVARKNSIRGCLCCKE